VAAFSAYFCEKEIIKQDAEPREEKVSMVSKALEVNLACSRVDVTIDEKYRALQEVMSELYGKREDLDVFLKELCHPYRNWEFIVKEARGYALNYLHVLDKHPKGPEAARLFIEIFFQAIEGATDRDVKVKAVDNLLLFVQKLIRENGDHLGKFKDVLHFAFEHIQCYEDEIFFLFVKSYYQVDKLAQSLPDAASPEYKMTALKNLLIKYYRHVYDYWLGQEDPSEWFEKEMEVSAESREALSELFKPLSHQQIGQYKEELSGLARMFEKEPEPSWKRLVGLPGYGEIVKTYEEMPRKIVASCHDETRGKQWQMMFLLHTMSLSGLSSIHEETLRNINRAVGWFIAHEEYPVVKQALEKIFAVLKQSVVKYPGIALNCLRAMGDAIYETDKGALIGHFIDSVVSLGFQSPETEGVGDDWQVRVNPAHIQNIRTWLHLIQLNPKRSGKLLSSLIIHLSLGGVFIRDTDLFPRDITQLLNSEIRPVYNLTKQLTRLFPAYFSDIGAEGRLRDISTKIDELCLRKDVLVHFLRKQSHVESSNRIIGLVEGTFDFWRTKDKEGIRPYVPPNIYEQIETGGAYIDGVHQIVSRLFETRRLVSVRDLLAVDETRLNTSVGAMAGVTDLDFERVKLAISLYKLLYQKYNLGFFDMEGYLAQLQSSGLPALAELREALEEKDNREKLARFLGYLEKLKKVILSREGYEAREDIYRKRHFTIDIPSMYGSYHEMKFDALGLTFRLESLVNVLFEEAVETCDLELITRASLFHIHGVLKLFRRALRLDGISTDEFDRNLDLLAHSLDLRGFSASQYVDVFRGLSQAVNNIVTDHFNNIHQDNLIKIVHEMPLNRLAPKFQPRDGADDPGKVANRVLEIFLRDRIASSLGLQQLDLLLGRVLKTLYQESNELPEEKLRLFLSYDPQKVVTPLRQAKEAVSDMIHLGSKGLNLVKLIKYGLPVPPGFIITTEVFRCLDVLETYGPGKRNFEEQVARELAALERATGKAFGDRVNPLLLSVRSGSAISQPGMMNTVLDVGINQDVVRALIAVTGNEWFGWDTYRRFLQSYGMAFGLSRDAFDGIMDEFKARSGLAFKREFTGLQMMTLALRYKDLIRESGIPIEESPLGQLYIAVGRVLNSWYSSKAETYRKIMGISDDWGTAVTVQAMVFGNCSGESGAGVVFTHNPRWSGDMLSLWGDYSIGNQGEDVVSGLVRTLPISKKQAEIENREIHSALESRFREIYHALEAWAAEIVHERKWSPQEMEFTFEGPGKDRLYILQTRDMAVREKKVAPSFDAGSKLTGNVIGHGIGVSGGAMSGRAVFTLEEIEQWKKEEPGTPLILVRGDTVPDDIREIHEADGLLTSRGGATSHAAIVAHRLGKTCVVGCANLVCMEKKRSCSLGEEAIRSGGWISIDGLGGFVYLGRLEIGSAEKS
jgi:pyruvate,orthophosphate dikinase